MKPSPADAKKVTILGAGIAGMSTASELARSGVPVTVLEKQDVVGGLAKSLRHGDYTVDLGPHRFHSGNQEVMGHVHDLMKDKLHERERKSRIWMMNRFFFYPLRAENVLAQLPRWILIKILWDYAVARVSQLVRPRPDDSFEDWVTHRFGKTLYKIFFDVYTEKTWGLPCTEISADWASQRISLLSLGDVVKKTLLPSKNNVPRTYASSFVYPRTGGIGSICHEYREEVEGLGGKIVTSIDLERLVVEGGRVASVVYRNGEIREEETPGQVVSTIPLGTLLSLLEPAPPDEILAHADALRHRSLVFVYLVLERENVSDDHWIYVPERERLVNRLSEAKNFSHENAPSGRTALCAEVTCVHGDGFWTAPDEEIADQVVDDVVAMGFCTKGQVLETFVHRERHGYPVYDIGYKEHLNACKEHLATYENLVTVGRQGLFRYNNMDHSVLMGRRAAHTIMGRLEDFDAVAASGDYFD